MFVSGKGGYNKDDEQFFRGKFLMIFDHPDDKNFGKDREIRCLIKQVHMKQLGQWMMAIWMHDGFKLSLSGTYGGDGLPISTAGNPEKAAFVRKLWDQLHPVPPEIVTLFWNDDGHNSSGKNGKAIHEWASEGINEYAKLRVIPTAAGG